MKSEHVDNHGNRQTVKVVMRGELREIAIAVAASRPSREIA